MKVIVTPRAEDDIANNYAWGQRAFGKPVADRTFARLRKFIEVSLASHPRAGRPQLDENLYESWVPRTPFIVFYRVDNPAQTVWVLAIFQHAQDRSQIRHPPIRLTLSLSKGERPVCHPTHSRRPGPCAQDPYAVTAVMHSGSAHENQKDPGKPTWSLPSDESRKMPR
jgi:plasmid stabilization system protein ParE